MMFVRHRSLLIVPIVALLSALHESRADDTIEGVRAAALDQPRIYLNLRRTAAGPVLETTGVAKTSAIEAFLDTGASGTVISSTTAEQLGIKDVKSRDGKQVSFEDIGIGGFEKFSVSEPLYAALAPYPNGEDPADFDKPLGPTRVQIRPEGGILAMIAPGMDIVGMPMMQGRVIVMDPSPLAKFDKIRTSLVAPGDRSIPKTSRHVPLTYVSFAKFTRLSPKDAPGPDSRANPMIGPDPLVVAGATTRAARSSRGDSRGKSIVITHRGKSASGTFLLDTGAATSMISTKLADQLGLDLDKVPKDQQISLAVGGLGGQKDARGTYFDRLEIPTREGKPIVYERAPLLVCDITVADEKGNTFTLDGVLGMNYLVASAEITGGLLPDVGQIVDGPFRWIVIDHARGEMGLEPR